VKNSRGQVPGLDQFLLRTDNLSSFTFWEYPFAKGQEIDNACGEEHNADGCNTEEAEGLLPALSQEIIEDDEWAGANHGERAAQYAREAQRHQEP
jgi:hypothetical protein